MGRAGDPADVVVCIEGNAFLLVLFAQGLEPVVVDKNCGRTTLSRIRLHGLLEGEHGWCAVNEVI